MALLPIHARDLDQYEIDILSMAVGTADVQRMRSVLNSYDTDVSSSLYVYRPTANTIGILGLAELDAEDARILHIAVDPLNQRNGIGRLLVATSITELGLRTLRAESDAEAVGFYAAAGFDIVSLGEKYPGVERFECTMSV